MLACSRHSPRYPRHRSDETGGEWDIGTLSQTVLCMSGTGKNVIVSALILAMRFIAPRADSRNCNKLSLVSELSGPGYWIEETRAETPLE